MLVKERMTRNPLSIKPDTGVSEAQTMMKREKIHHLPVLDKDEKLVGIVTEKDLLYASPSVATTLSVYEMTSLLAKLHVDKVMTRDVVTITEDVPLEEAARIMADRRIGGLPIMRGPTLVGMITESDLFASSSSCSARGRGACAFPSRCRMKRGSLQGSPRRLPAREATSSRWGHFSATTREAGAAR